MTACIVEAIIEPSPVPSILSFSSNRGFGTYMPFLDAIAS